MRDGLLYGRGSCDMKGGVAAMVVAAETLSRLGIRLAGDLSSTRSPTRSRPGPAASRRWRTACAPTPESSPSRPASRSGSPAAAPCTPTITVEGRPGHAELLQPHWRDGGAVNAIEKAQVVLEAITRLREEWRTRSDLRHAYLSPADIVPTVMHAGEWAVTYPASCAITSAVLFPPALADADGYGSRVRAEVQEWIELACAADPWLAGHPPVFEWAADIPPMEIAPGEPIVETVMGASADVGEPARLGGLDSWYDGATYTLSASTPSVGFGPRSISVGHTIDENVPIDDLVRCSQAIALAALRFCGTA